MKKKKELKIESTSITTMYYMDEEPINNAVFAKNPKQLEFFSGLLNVCYSVGNSTSEDDNTPFKCSLCKTIIRPKHNREITFGKVTYVYNAEYLTHLMFCHNLLPPWKLIQAILHSYFSTIQIKKAITDMSREELIEMLEDNNTYIKNMEARLQVLEEERMPLLTIQPTVNIADTISSLTAEENDTETEEGTTETEQK